MRAKETNKQRLERLEQALSTLPDETLESICNAFELLDPLSLAKWLHSLQGVSDGVKGEILRCKISQPPAAAPDLFTKALDRNMAAFWQRISTARAA